MKRQRSYSLLVLPISLLAAFACGQDRDRLKFAARCLRSDQIPHWSERGFLVYQFDLNRDRSVFATVTTDSTGAFRFNPPRPGDYYVEVTKADYFGTSAAYPNKPLPNATGSLLTLNASIPSRKCVSR